jgi:hypothetical protein
VHAPNHKIVVGTQSFLVHAPNHKIAVAPTHISKFARLKAFV